MPRYEVTHRLGVYINGLGSRPCGGVFDVSPAKANRLALDDNQYLKRIEARPKRASKPKQTDDKEG